MVRRKELYEAEEKTLQVMLAEEEEEKEKERREMQRKKQGTVICIHSRVKETATHFRTLRLANTHAFSLSVYQIKSTVEKVSQRSAVARGNASDALAGCIRLVNVSFLEQSKSTAN